MFEEDLDKVDIYLNEVGSSRFKKKKNVPLDKDTVEVGNYICNIQKSDLCHNGNDLRLYYTTHKNDPREGGLNPISWSRFDEDISGADIYDIEHDVSAFEGVMNMLGVGGAGTLNKKHWIMIAAVAIAGVAAFLYLRPYLPMM